MNNRQLYEQMLYMRQWPDNSSFGPNPAVWRALSCSRLARRAILAVGSE
jgi:hypothetical protein